VYIRQCQMGVGGDDFVWRLALPLVENVDIPNPDSRPRDNRLSATLGWVGFNVFLKNYSPPISNSIMLRAGTERCRRLAVSAV
jgi:hypothetical protein